MSNRKRNNIEFSRPEEPSFLKKLKNQMGIQKELVTIDTKKEQLSAEDLSHRDEEPVYVLEEESGVTESELESFKEKTQQEKEFQKDNETKQRIIFRKPTQSSSGDLATKIGSGSFQTTKKTAAGSVSSDEKMKNRSKQIKTVKNSSLLSFNDDDDDGDED